MKILGNITVSGFLPYGVGIIAIFSFYLLVWTLLGHRQSRGDTLAQQSDDLIGLLGTVSSGSAARNRPAKAIVTDRFDRTHEILIEPHHHRDVIQEGDEILLIRRIGSKFFAVSGGGPVSI